MISGKVRIASTGFRIPFAIPSTAAPWMRTPPKIAFAIQSASTLIARATSRRSTRASLNRWPLRPVLLGEGGGTMSLSRKTIWIGAALVAIAVAVVLIVVYSGGGGGGGGGH